MGRPNIHFTYLAHKVTHVSDSNCWTERAGILERKGAPHDTVSSTVSPS